MSRPGGVDKRLRARRAIVCARGQAAGVDPMRVTVSQRFASSLRRGCDYSTDLQRQPERWPGLIDLAFSLAPVGAGRHGTFDAWGAQTAGEVQLRRIDP
jgi:hypothetical protein